MLMNGNWIVMTWIPEPGSRGVTYSKRWVTSRVCACVTCVHLLKKRERKEKKINQTLIVTFSHFPLHSLVLSSPSKPPNHHLPPTKPPIQFLLLFHHSIISFHVKRVFGARILGFGFHIGSYSNSKYKNQVSPLFYHSRIKGIDQDP